MRLPLAELESGCPAWAARAQGVWVTPMGKRSNFPRFPQDSYNTPAAVIGPLLPHLAPGTRFIEPCAGKGYLIGHLKRAGHVLIGALRSARRRAGEALCRNRGRSRLRTNPPWRRDVLHPIIANLSDQAPTWLLIDADWAHTRQSIPYLPRLRTIVSVGRVKWIPDSPFTGKDNCRLASIRPSATRWTSADSLHRPDRFHQEDRPMIVRCHICNADPCGRWRSPPMCIFIDPYQEDGDARDDPVYACRDCLSAKREAEICVRERSYWRSGELR